MTQAKEFVTSFCHHNSSIRNFTFYENTGITYHIMVLSHDGTAADIRSINSMARQSFILGSSADDSNSMEQDDDENLDASESVVGSDINKHDITAEVRQALKKEDRGVFMWRLFFKIIMIVVAIVLTVATYVQLSRSETRDFTNQVRYSMPRLNISFSILNTQRSCRIHSILPPV
jgi:hypothetical protein